MEIQMASYKLFSFEKNKYIFISIKVLGAFFPHPDSYSHPKFPKIYNKVVKNWYLLLTLPLSLAVSWHIFYNQFQNTYDKDMKKKMMICNHWPGILKEFSLEFGTEDLNSCTTKLVHCANSPVSFIQWEVQNQREGTLNAKDLFSLPLPHR